MTRREDLIDAAQRILETEGPEAVSMRRLGDELGMRAPSLYKHISGKAEIEAELQARALRGIADALLGCTALDELAVAYRGWAREHPRLYEISSRPLHRDRLPDGVEDAAAAPLLDAVGGDLDVARAVWGMAHGLVELERAGRFPPGTDLDTVWAAGTAAFKE